MQTYELHPLCSLFPRMDGASFTALRDDIAKNGLTNPITVHDGMILDGGNRYRACLDAGVTPQFVKFTGDNAVTFVLSSNLHRRHMSAGQQAAIVASATDWATAHSHGGNRRADQGAGLHLETVKDRAAASGAAERTQKYADKLVREAPELAKQVAQGEKSLYQAVRESKPPKPRQDMPQDQPEPTETDIATDALDEANDRAHDLAIELEAYMLAAGENGEAAKEIVRLNGMIETLKRNRDEWQNKCAELLKQVKAEQAKVKRLEAKIKTIAADGF